MNKYKIDKIGTTFIPTNNNSFIESPASIIPAKLKPHIAKNTSLNFDIVLSFGKSKNKIY